MAHPVRVSCSRFHALCFHALRSPLRKILVLVPALFAALLISVSAHAQTQQQQQYVFASVPVTSGSEVASFSKDANGNLIAAPNSPIADSREGGLVAVDALGRFLFVINRNISMFMINQDGSLSPVAGSPFATPATVNPLMTPSLPTCLATEKSGKFLYVGYQNGNYPDKSAILEFWIDQGSPLALAPVSIASTDAPAMPIGIFTSQQNFLYVALGSNPDSTSSNQPEGTFVYSIDPLEGGLAPLPNGGSANNNERAIAIDPRGRFLFDGWAASSAGFLESAAILADGTAVPSAVARIPTFSGQVPSAMLVDGGGKFLYV